MKIPYRELSAEALTGVIDDYVLREGTDYGDFAEGTDAHSLPAKRAAVQRALETGAAELWFDDSTQTTTIREADSSPAGGPEDDSMSGDSGTRA